MSRERTYFGTDGIRGKVGTPPITPEFVMKLGWAAGRVLAKGGGGRILIGKDTRISGYMFESALEAGLSAAGVDIRLLGPMPTPAVAYLTRTFHARAGIVISASHNPYHDNGIKFFSSDGTKLPDEVELQIEAELERPLKTVESSRLGKAERVEDAPGRYIEFCKRTIGPGINLNGLKIVVDCAHGATYHIAPNVFDELGAHVICIGVEPNGLNINDSRGATKPEALQAKVLDTGADLGIALDGDGDRAIMVDHNGDVVDGDEIMYIIAEARCRNNSLTGAVVGTQMSNLGLEHAVRNLGLEFKRAKVGDRYIMEMLLEGGWTLGGETSGHIICLDLTTTGDGIVSALQVLAAMTCSGQPLNALKSGMSKYPQQLINVTIDKPVDIGRLASIQNAVREVETELGDDGRVLLRPSGTEPVVRIMVEGKDALQVDALANQLASLVKDALTQTEHIPTD
ncbi:MAG: phosphoglucosamine mutase [Gammaproteobacteria bacterium]|nr:phosphoglucosamine mutase [Gammaproteobacteria bacterium]MCI0591356.1 phosphoglucosamine mutase [Gammaproteobacteria bacterium]